MDPAVGVSARHPFNGRGDTFWSRLLRDRWLRGGLQRVSDKGAFARGTVIPGGRPSLNTQRTRTSNPADAMSMLAIIALSVIAVTLIPAIILIKPTPSRVGDGGMAPRPARKDRRQHASSGNKTTPSAAKDEFSVALPRSRAEGGTGSIGAVSEQRGPAGSLSGARIWSYLLEPQPEKPRRHLPHTDGFADLPLCFRHRNGSHYTMRWRLCVN